MKHFQTFVVQSLSLPLSPFFSSSTHAIALTAAALARSSCFGAPNTLPMFLNIDAVLLRMESIAASERQEHCDSCVAVTPSIPCLERVSGIDIYIVEEGGNRLINP